jgi:membrane associated rhomboid family serine protease
VRRILVPPSAPPGHAFRFIPAALLIGLWFLVQLLNLGAVAQVQSGGVAYLAHIAGMIFGAVTARLFEDPRRVAEQRGED